MIKLLLNKKSKIKLKLDCVLTAVNENTLYLDFVPIFIKTWNKLYPKTDVKIILIMDEIPEDLKEYSKNIIIFNPIENMSTSFISQYIRILYPAILNYKSGILITDIDMLPMNRDYFSKYIENISIDNFVYMRNYMLNKRQFYVCYNIATSKVWRDIFNINSLEDINNRLKFVYSNINYIDGTYNNAWNTDQYDLFKYVAFWNTCTKNLIVLKDSDTNFNRLDRGNFDLSDESIVRNIKNGKYTDYHCLRPYKDYQKINNEIYNML